MKKRFVAKRKKKSKLSYYIYAVLFLSIFVFTLFSLRRVSLPLTNEEFLRNLIYHSNHNIPYNYTKQSAFTKVMKFLANVNLDNPTSILDHTYTGLVENPTKADSDANDNLEDLEANSDYIHDPDPSKNLSNPRVYVYNTHQLENYDASTLAEYNVRPNVMMASYILREKLNNFGIPTMVEEGNVSEVLKANNWNYASSYKVTKMFMQSAKEQHPSIEYFIDMHRDSVGRTITFKTIGDKNYARILFIVGMENPNYEANLKLTTEINNRLEERYPGLTRGIYKKEGPGVDGVYNQDVSPNTILVEMGGAENTIEEVLNSTEVLASVLYEYIGGQS